MMHYKLEYIQSMQKFLKIEKLSNLFKKEDAINNAMAIKECEIEDLKYKIEQLENYEIQVINAYEQVQAKDQ